MGGEAGPGSGTLNLTADLRQGLGMSLVNAKLEELVYCRLNGIVLDFGVENGSYFVKMNVFEIQVSPTCEYLFYPSIYLENF